MQTLTTTSSLFQWLGNDESPMRLAYLAPIRLPSEKAHTIQIVKTCEALGRQGIPLTLYASRLQAPLEEVWRFYGVRDPFPVIHIPAPPTVGWGRVGYALHALAFALRAIRKEEDNADTLFYTRDWWAALMLRRRGLPYVFEAHGPQLHWVARQALEGAQGVVAITQSLQRFLQENGIRVPSLVVHDAVDGEKFQLTHTPPTAPPFLVRYVGSVDRYEWKGIHYLIAAAALLDPKQFRVQIIGAGESWKERFAPTLPPSLEALPKVTHTQVPRILSDAHALVIPNDPTHPHGARFTSPLKLFEYMAAGRPIVASDVPAIREVLPEDAAFYVDVRDARAFARAIEEACTSPHAHARAERAREIALRYTWDTRAKTIASFLRDITKA